MNPEHIQFTERMLIAIGVMLDCGNVDDAKRYYFDFVDSGIQRTPDQSRRLTALFARCYPAKQAA